MKQWNHKREVMHDYDHLATIYDAQYSEEQKAKIDAALEIVKPKENNLTLDIGCGTGLLFQQIATSTKLLLGIDISLKILKEAKKRAKLLPNVNIVRADADFMPFPNSLFDNVFAITLLQNMPNPSQTLDEIKRVSKHPSTIIATGLKKKFSQKQFHTLLKKSGLKVIAKKTNDQLKGYLAICKI